MFIFRNEKLPPLFYNLEIVTERKLQLFRFSYFKLCTKKSCDKAYSIIVVLHSLLAIKEYCLFLVLTEKKENVKTTLEQSFLYVYLKYVTRYFNCFYEKKLYVIYIDMEEKY